LTFTMFHSVMQTLVMIRSKGRIDTNSSFKNRRNFAFTNL